MNNPAEPWRVSLHGGHSGQYCDHATGTLDEVVQAAEAAGMNIFGLSEHAPRTRSEYLYDVELDMGWTVDTLASLFADYVPHARRLAASSEHTQILVGYECEVVPQHEYREFNDALRAEHGFDFVVGSVHFLRDRSIDGPRPLFEEALQEAGDLEALCVEYYDTLAKMVSELRPEVVGHFDLIRKNGRHYGDVDTPSARSAALRALDIVAEFDGILDLNCAGFRKGLDHPYPAPWLVHEAASRGVPFCFGDDSHGPGDVGRDLERGRDYLLGLGVESITSLTRTDDGIVRVEIPLNAP